jgi:hypothetical protein
MLTDNLLDGVPFDGLRAGVPVCYDALGVEHVDGVVANALDQHAEALLAVTQPVLGFALMADIARDLGEADDFAVAVARRIDDDAGPKLRAILAGTPAFRLELTFLGGDAKRLLGQTCRPIRFGVEA